MKYIGIDLGSSYIKAVLIDIGNNTVVGISNMKAPSNEKGLDTYKYEIQASEIVNIVKNLIDKYTKSYDDIEGIILSTQMHGFIYSTPNKEDMYISWQDMRSLTNKKGADENYISFLSKKITQESMLQQGVYIKPSLGICNLYAMLEEEQDTPRDGTFYTLGSYVINALTGQNVAHIQNAAPSGIANIVRVEKANNLLAALNLNDITYPRITNKDYEACGIYKSNGLDLKVFPDYGDMQISILGCDIGPGDVVINTATAAQVIRYSDIFLPSNDYEIRPFFDGSYLYTISNMPAGRNLDVLVNFFKEIVYELTGNKVDSQQIWKYFHKGTEYSNDELVVDINFYKNPYSLNGGSIRNITHNNLRMSIIFNAAIKNMAETYWRFIKKLGAEPSEIDQIICAGGVNWRTPELCDAIGKVSNKPWRLSSMENESIAGLFRLALVCSGRFKNMHECMEMPISIK
ncbi:sedoheptulokinase [Kallipyga massiliensis]|uniref:sedoheptulokinase n=1 Tax=Kallipyga massiliensis TaxID=1472764 RepID=UPI0004BBAF42|nr:FGGY family carbohydrate kinase [Kallipyga massiliensis]